MTKTCTKCQIEKSLTEFYRNGSSAMCKKCEYARQRIYEAKHPELRRQTINRYQEKHKAALNLRSKQYCRDNVEARMLTTARRRAKLQGLAFGLELTDIIIPAVCPILGVALKISDTGKASDNSPSLDRIIPSMGYVKGNVAVISHRANVIKSFGTIEEHEKIIHYMRERLITAEHLPS